MIILTHFIFKISFLKSFFSIVAASLIFNIVSLLFLNPYMTFFNLSSEQLSTIPLYRLLYVILVYSCVFIVTTIIKKRSLKIKFIDDIDKKSKLIIFSNLILGLLTLFVQTFIAIYYIDKLPILITSLSFISLIAYFGLSIYSLTRVFKLTLTTRKLESAEEYNNTLHILHDNVRGFKHDFDNIVTTIGGYIRTEDMNGLKKYYLQLEDDCQRVNNLYLLNPEIINNDGIYNLLTKKYYEDGIRMSFDEHGVSGADAYLTRTAAGGYVPANYEDPVTSSHSMDALGTVSIAWDESGDFKTNLEQIITQKYIALYPVGHEAWTEFRRTGYPKVFPVVVNESSGGSVDTNIQIRRLPYPESEYNTNRTELDKGITLLGGVDNPGVRLWWDVPNK